MGGLIRVKDYNYDWKYPMSYIQAFMSDAPHVDYEWEEKVKWNQEHQIVEKKVDLNDLAKRFGLNMATKKEKIYLKDL